MSSQNFFALLDDDENEDPQALITRAAGPAVAEKPVAQKKVAPKQQLGKATPTEAAKEPLKSVPLTATDGGRGRGGARGGRGGGERGGFRGGRDGGFRQSYGDREGGRRFNGEGGEVAGNQGGRGGGGKTEDGENRNTEGGRGGGGRGRAGRGRGFYGGGRGEGGEGRGFQGNRGEGSEVGARDDRRHFRRDYDRQSGTGRGHEMKRHGAGQGNWGVEGEIPAEELTTEETAPVKDGPTDETLPEGAVAEVKVEAGGETPVEGEEAKANGEEKKAPVEEEDKEMTLDEYEKMMEEKRKALLANRAEVRKVEEDKDFQTMQKVQKPLDEELVLLKLGAEKERVAKKNDEDEEKEKKPKPVNINEFLRPAEGETYYPRNRGGARGGGRGERREGRGGFRGNNGDRDNSGGGYGGGGYGGGGRGYGGGRGGYSGGYGNVRNNSPQIDTEDQAQFPTLGGK